MMSRANTIRLIAIVLLLAAAFDYFAFDVWDPSAPMNSAASGAIPGVVPQTVTTTTVRTPDLPDDHCLGCSPWIAPPRPLLPQVSFSSSVTQGPKAALASNDPDRMERPPRA
jgi:hypothetical protein